MARRKPQTKKETKCDEKDENFRGRGANRRKSAENDPSWYATDPAIMRDAASIPFSWATGTTINLGNIAAFKSAPDYVVPGIQVEYLIPSVGYSQYPNDPINIASTAVYSFVRHANSGSRNYDSPDLMLYITGMSNVYSYINFLQRAYGMATLYAQRNRYLPYALLRSNFLDADDIQSNLADFRYGINVLINKAASFAVPSTMSIFNRQAFLYQSLYTEGTSIKDQLYMYAPLAFWRFQLDSESAGMLKMVPFVTTNPNSGDITYPDFDNLGSMHYYTVAELLEFGNSLLDPLLQSEDIGIMSGDILKAYTQSGIIGLQSLPTEYPLLPTFDIGVLEQMKNATVLPNIPTANRGVVSFTNTDVTQSSNKGYLISTPEITIPDLPALTHATSTNYGLYMLTTILGENRILTTTTSEVTPELVMESSRLMLGMNLDVLQSSATMRIYSGSEICAGALFWQFNYYNGSRSLFATHSEYVDINPNNILVTNTTSTAIPDWANMVTSAVNLIQTKLDRHTVLENFRFHPELHDVVAKYDGQEIAIDMINSGLAFDIDNYAVITWQDLQRLHEAALLNMLHVPSIAKLS